MHISRFLIAFLISYCLMASAVAQEAIHVSHGYTPFGDLKYPSDFRHFDYVNPEAPKGGTLRLLGHGTFDSLNPYVMTGRSPSNTPGAFVFGFLETTDTLLMGTSNHNRIGDEARAGYGLIAETLEYPENMDWVIFNLRPEARFNDGHPITAEDVVFSYHTLKEHGHPRYALMLSDVTDVESLSKQRVKFHLEGKHRRDLPLTIGELPVLPAHYWQDRDFSSTLEPPVTSAPYTISEVDPGRRVIFQRNEDYWAADLPVNTGRYNFDQVVFEYFRDAQIGFESFKSGGYDVHLDYIAKHWATAYDFPAMRDGRVLREEKSHSIPQGTQAFFFNTRREPFADWRVRKALGLLFDFEWTNRSIFNDAYQRSQTWFPNSDNAAHGLPSAAEKALLEPWKEQLPEGLFTQPVSLPTTDGSGNIRPQMQQALALFEQAGWTISQQKLVHQKTGEQFSIEFLNYHNPGMDRVVMPYLKNLRRLGIDARYRSIDPASYKERTDRFDFDAIIFVLPQNVYPGSELIDYFHSRSANLEGSRNFAGIDDPVINALVESALAAETLDRFRTAIHALDRVLLWKHYSLPHWHLGHHRIAWWDKYEQPENDAPYILGTETWWARPE